ncbi:MAG: hypothetical protein ACK5R4_05190 [Alphaproteobacteria bacterium]|jgi:hypothetical protein
MRPEDHPQNWHEEKTYESMITYGLNAIKFVLIANGGAILALLTFLGNHSEKIAGIKPAIICYVIGVLLGGIVNLTAYATQLFLFNQRDDVHWCKDHRTLLYLSLAIIFLGIICFAVGSLFAMNALS